MGLVRLPYYPPEWRCQRDLDGGDFDRKVAGVGRVVLPPIMGQRLPLHVGTTIMLVVASRPDITISILHT